MANGFDSVSHKAERAMADLLSKLERDVKTIPQNPQALGLRILAFGHICENIAKLIDLVNSSPEAHAYRMEFGMLGDVAALKESNIDDPGALAVLRVRDLLEQGIKALAASRAGSPEAAQRALYFIACLYRIKFLLKIHDCQFSEHHLIKEALPIDEEEEQLMKDTQAIWTRWQEQWAKMEAAGSAKATDLPS